MAGRSVIIGLCLLSFCATAPATKDPQKELKILFAGNSLSYVNDLPALLAEIARQDGITVSYTSFLFPDYSLEDHWNEGKVKAEIEKGNYDFVVAQQGPSALPESQLLLLDYTRKFAGVCNSRHTKLALYMVWPSLARDFDRENVISSYTNAARETGSLLCPAGLAWKYGWSADSTLALYSADNFHPSLMGSVLAALTIYGSLTGKKNFDFIRYGECSWKNEIPLEKWTLLKTAASLAVSQ